MLYTPKTKPGFHQLTKARQLHFLSSTEMLERRAEAVKGHDKLLEASNHEVERRRETSSVVFSCARQLILPRGMATSLSWRMAHAVLLRSLAGRLNSHSG